MIEPKSSLDSKYRRFNMSRFCCHYKIQFLQSKGAILVLLWDIIISLHETFLQVPVVYALQIVHPGDVIEVTNTVLNVTFLVWLCCPLAGMIADVWTGRYTVIIASFYISFCALITGGIGIIVFQYNEQIATVVFWLSIALQYIGMLGFRSCVVPFNIDQLLGASGDQLSAVIYWHGFAFLIGTVLSGTLGCAYVFPSYLAFFLTHILIAGGAIVTVSVTNSLLNSWLDITPNISNPIKLIIRVLNYARKNKYPRNRSALTYWEENYPSRLDLGKEKYGGPFSEEQVEDVKTVLQLIPLIAICAMVYGMAFEFLAVPQHLLPSKDKYMQCLVYYSVLPYITAAILVPTYQFLIYPFFYKCIPSMLKRIGMGLVFALLSTLSYALIVLVGHVEKNSNTCATLNENKYINSYQLPVDYHWVMIPQILTGITYFFIFITSLEFTVAQCPMRMRGLVVGLWYAALGFGLLVGTNLYRVFLYIESVTFGCGFYYFCAKGGCILILLIVFLFLSKHYKLRVRENIVPIHQIAEEHIERYIDQREEFDKGYGSCDLSNIIIID